MLGHLLDHTICKSTLTAMQILKFIENLLYYRIKAQVTV